MLKLRNSAPSPSMNTSVSAVATSWRPRRPSRPIPSAPNAANTPRPSSVPIADQVGAGGAGDEPLGIAWATNAEPRSTVKNPTTPATTATIVADRPGVDHEAGEHRRLSPGSGRPRSSAASGRSLASRAPAAAQARRAGRRPRSARRRRNSPASRAGAAASRSCRRPSGFRARSSRCRSAPRRRSPCRAAS